MSKQLRATEAVAIEIQSLVSGLKLAYKDDDVIKKEVMRVISRYRNEDIEGAAGECDKLFVEANSFSKRNNDSNYGIGAGAYKKAAAKIRALIPKTEE